MGGEGGGGVVGEGGGIKLIRMGFEVCKGGMKMGGKGNSMPRILALGMRIMGYPCRSQARVYVCVCSHTCVHVCACVCMYCLCSQVVCKRSHNGNEGGHKNG